MTTGKRALWLMVAMLSGAGAAWAAPTPLDAPLKDDGVTTIECDVVENTKPYDHYYEWFPAHILVAGTFGDKDSNVGESHKIRRNLARSRTEILLFPGGHSSAPAEVFGQALDWMEESLFLNPVPPAAAAQPFRLAKAVPVEPVEAEAWGWYLRKCRRQLDEFKDGPARYMALTRAIDAVAKGRLGSDKDVAEAARKWQAELQEMKRTQPIRDFEGKTLLAHRQARAIEDAFARQMRTARSTYANHRMPLSAAERQLLQQAIAAYQAVVELHSDSVFAAECRLRLASLEIELSKAK